MELRSHGGTWLMISISWNSAHIASNLWLRCRVGPSLSQLKPLFAHRQLWLPSPFLPLRWIPMAWRTHASPLSLADRMPLFFLFHDSNNTEVRGGGNCWALKTRTSKNVHWRRSPQNPCAFTSRRAPSSVLAVLWLRSSPDRGCSSGSVLTLWHTSLRRSVVTSLILLWCNDGRPLQGQLKAWLTMNCLPHTHSVGRCPGCHPYGKHRASLNAMQSHVLLWGVLTASLMLPSHKHSPLLIASALEAASIVSAWFRRSFRCSFLICCFSCCCSIFIEWE